MKRFVRLIAALAICSSFQVALPEPVQAECDGPIPDFRAVVRSAERVFIGDVTAVENPGEGGFGSRFTVRVGYVLRGQVHRWPMRIRDLEGSLCSPDIVASKGQRIALALGGDCLLDDGSDATNSVAYITGEAPVWLFASDPHLRADEVYRLAGVRLDTSGVGAPDTATSAVHPKATTVSTAHLLMIFAFALSVALWCWPTGRRRRPPSDIPGN